MKPDHFDGIEPDADSRWWPRRRVILSCQKERGPLLVRYFLLHTTHLSIFLHHFLSSDDDRALHDHPWSFISVLLSNGYWEHTVTERIWRRRFSVLYRPAEWQHRVELDGPVWTLVFKFKSRRVWGFVMKDGWHRWTEYLTAWCND